MKNPLYSTLPISIMISLLSVSPAHASAPELPREQVSVALPAVTGRVISVQANGDFQQALNDAQPGDAIELQAGATYNAPDGGFLLPNKPSRAGSFITIRSSHASSLAAFGSRTSPREAALMPKIISLSNLAGIRSAPGAGGYYILGLDVSPAPNVQTNTGLIRIGDGSEANAADLAHDIIVDRSYIHCLAAQSCTRGVALNGVREAVVGSYIEAIHADGYDAQAVAGWNGYGPYKIENNYLESSGENVLFGGADPGIKGLIPSDIEVRGNYLFKPLSWKIDDPSFAGIPWTVKNLIELKSAQRVRFVGNVMENCWPMAQSGYAILLRSRNQDLGAPWSFVGDIAIESNIIRNVASVYNIAGVADPAVMSVPVDRVRIANNLSYRVGTPQPYDGVFAIIQAGAREVSFEHNTSDHVGDLLIADGAVNSGFIMRDNIVNYGGYGIKGPGMADGLPTLQTFFPGFVFSSNVLAGTAPADLADTNFVIASRLSIGYTNPDAGDYSLLSLSAFKARASDGTDLGINVAALIAATAHALDGAASAPAPVRAQPAPAPVAVQAAKGSGNFNVSLSVQVASLQVKMGQTLAVSMAANPANSTRRGGALRVDTLELLVNGVSVCKAAKAAATCSWAVPQSKAAKVYKLKVRAADLSTRKQTVSDVLSFTSVK